MAVLRRFYLYFLVVVRCQEVVRFSDIEADLDQIANGTYFHTSNGTKTLVWKDDGHETEDYSRFTQFDFQNDIMVYLHMQKTGGTNFGRHLG